MGNGKISLVLVLIAFLIKCISMQEQTYELDVLKIELHNGSDLVSFDGLRVKRYNRTVYVIDGNLHVHRDFDEKWDVQMDVWRSKLGNNQFELTPMRVPRQSTCEFIKNIYKDKMYPSFKISSNFPKFEEDVNCPFPKGDYTVRNHMTDCTHFPPYMQDGVYRLSTWVSRNGEIMLGYSVHMKISQKIE